MALFTVRFTRDVLVEAKDEKEALVEAKDMLEEEMAGITAEIKPFEEVFENRIYLNASTWE